MSTAETEVSQPRPPARNATPNLNKALSQLQGELPKVAKSKHVKVDGKDGRRGYEYSYAELADVAVAVGPLLAKFGLAFYCAVTRDPADRRLMILEWSLLHESGEERSGEWPLGPAGQSPQTLGSAITYGRRYCLGAATGVVTDDDDDGQRAQDHSNRQSAGDAWENSTTSRPNGNGNGTQRGQVSRPAQPPKPAAAPAAEDIDIDAQAYADDAHGALTVREVEEIHKKAREAGKVAAFVRNPSSEGIGKLAVYLDWRRKQLKDVDDALAALNAVVQETGFPVGDLETHVKTVTGADMDSATAAQLKQAAQAMRSMQGAAA